MGITSCNTLSYGTAGVIVANVGAQVSEPYIQPPDYAAIFSGTAGWQTGWIAGGGIEYALADKWSIMGEALFYDLGTQTVSGRMINPITPPGDLYGWNIHSIGSTLRVGLNKGF